MICQMNGNSINMRRIWAIVHVRWVYASAHFKVFGCWLFMTIWVFWPLDIACSIIATYWNVLVTYISHIRAQFWGKGRISLFFLIGRKEISGIRLREVCRRKSRKSDSFGLWTWIYFFIKLCEKAGRCIWEIIFLIHMFSTFPFFHRITNAVQIIWLIYFKVLEDKHRSF